MPVTAIGAIISVSLCVVSDKSLPADNQCPIGLSGAVDT